jgi:Icc-related predicted phosphoesterase
MTRIVAISDIHSNLKFEVPEADLLLIAGDLCPADHAPHTSIDMQVFWLKGKFKRWLYKQPIKECVSISGNHDWIWEKCSSLVPDLGEKFHYLQDSEITLFGKKIYGTPWQPPFNDWAFNKEVDRLKLHWDNIPEDVDILLTHCPPYGILDETQHPNYPKEHIGDKNLLDRIKEVKPKLSIYGHNHNKNGIVEQNGITFVNCSMVDESYKLTREPIVLEI